MRATARPSARGNRPTPIVEEVAHSHGHTTDETRIVGKEAGDHRFARHIKDLDVRATAQTSHLTQRDLGSGTPINDGKEVEERAGV